MTSWKHKDTMTGRVECDSLYRNVTHKTFGFLLENTSRAEMVEHPCTMT